ncbi:uncharacterized protein J7T54_005682 [Emericellopsis cladophorae]|uniref:Cell wall mannoprotein PIR1-like C-terminal domain-containing protein n=1 Tax=Emericellopsis cladophorae TaxID=2686198 RepID=A0A9P9Y5W2_9HYPO|nr:uncharacterized protein J7T54_005682 [Emericellopsis cladophorae]KAI6783653.1 hypothetical protein J7T54_005682 [Emericellopsis cladophorae]
MRYSLSFESLLAAAATIAGIVEATPPPGSPPTGCQPTFSQGRFEIVVQPIANAKTRRQDGISGGALAIRLVNGVLADGQGRTGYIASNRQFQFDKPHQAGTIYDAGFSSCNNGHLALWSEETFYRCQSGNFFNLYDQSIAPHCEKVYIIIRAVGGSTPMQGSSPSQIYDGQIQAPQGIDATTRYMKQTVSPRVPTLTAKTTRKSSWASRETKTDTPARPSWTGRHVARQADGPPQAPGTPGASTPYAAPTVPMPPTTPVYSTAPVYPPVYPPIYPTTPVYPVYPSAPASPTGPVSYGDGCRAHRCW